MLDTRVIKDKEIATCYHCGDACREEHVIHDGKDFCCLGCKTVFEILQDNGLCTYYDLEKTPGINLKRKKFKDKYAYLDNPDVARSLLDFHDKNRAKGTFYMPSIHCSSCIWLLENLYKIQEGILQSRVNFVKKEFQVDFDPEKISLRALAELLTTIGYEPLISLENQKQKQKKSIDRSLYLKIGIAGFAFGNIMLLSFPEYFGFEGISDEFIRRFLSYLNLLLALPVVFYSASDYFKSALSGIKQRYVNIDVPISLGISVLFLRSLYEILLHSGPGYLDSLAGLVFFLLIGRWFQNFTYEGMSFERDYRSYFPLAVEKKIGQLWKSVLVSELIAGDEVLIRNLEIIPADSILMSDHAHIDYSFVTGESEPVQKQKGDQIYAGGRQIGEAITLNVVKSVSQSYLTQLWNNDVFSKEKDTGFVNFVNKISKYFTVVVLLLAALSFVYWLKHDFSRAMNALTAVLIVACPCALSLASPFTLGATMRIFGKNGFYIKNTNVIEKLLKITHLVFDKTGTITQNPESELAYEGKMLNQREKNLIVALVSNSTHPLSRRILESMKSPGVNLQVENYSEIPGSGIEATIEGFCVKVGSQQFLKLNGHLNGKHYDTSTQVYVSIDHELKGSFVIKNKYRKGLKTVIDGFGKLFKLSILTGDNESEKGNLSSLFPEDTVMHFKQSPQDKLNYIQELQEQGFHVLMVGDGLNDAGALQQSDVGIALTNDITAFTPAADAILDARTFQLLPKFIQFSRISRNIIISAFILSFIYNIVGIGFAMAGLLTPLFAAILMPLSSISVVVFATGMTNLKAKTQAIL